MAEQWDYEVAVLTYWTNTARWDMVVNGHTTVVPNMPTGLRQLGNEGWELVSVNLSEGRGFNSYVAVFKRRKP